MELLFADETNTSTGSDEKAKFFVYGGLIVPAESAEALDAGITEIRKKYGYRDGDILKFDTNLRPEQVTIEDFVQAKKDVVALCVELGCTFLVYVVLHQIAREQGINKTIVWGANTIISKFNQYLEKHNRRGLVTFDRVEGGDLDFDYLVEKFTRGLILPSGSTVHLGRIMGYSLSCTNASHFSSALDIVLGTFRYCINNPTAREATSSMMRNITKIIWARPAGKDIDPFELGLTFRPKTFTVLAYKAAYRELVTQINSLLNWKPAGPPDEA